MSALGIHMLVGSGAHRGPHRIRAWMPSLVHYCFLADPRTERVVAEPNAKNAKIIKVRLTASRAIICDVYYNNEY